VDLSMIGITAATASIVVAAIRLLEKWFASRPKQQAATGNHEGKGGDENMAFRVPNMPLMCNIYDWFTPLTSVPTPRQPNVPCQLRYLKSQEAQRAGAGNQYWSPLLLTHAGTDIRMYDATTGAQGDIVECPASSGLFFQVRSVGDVAKGFSNEYRSAALQSCNDQIGGWVVPQP